MLKRDDIDAVDVLVPIEDNFEVARAVVRANKNMIAEKPLAATLKGAEKLLELHKRYPVNIMVAENYRYNEENNIIRNIIKERRIGEVVYFINNNVVNFEEEMEKDTYAAKEWRQHPKFRGGTFLDAALHDIAAMRHIFFYNSLTGTESISVTPEIEYGDIKMVFDILESIKINHSLKVDMEYKPPTK